MTQQGREQRNCIYSKYDVFDEEVSVVVALDDFLEHWKFLQQLPRGVLKDPLRVLVVCRLQKVYDLQAFNVEPFVVFPDSFRP